MPLLTHATVAIVAGTELAQITTNAMKLQHRTTRFQKQIQILIGSLGLFLFIASNRA